MGTPVTAADLSDPARATTAVIHRHGEAIRTVIAERAGISLPSVTKAVHELESHGLVHLVRHEQGASGRATHVYGIAPTAGWVLGIDIGTTQISLQAQGLDTTVHHQTHLPVNDHQTLVQLAGDTVADLIPDMAAVDAGPLRAVCVAVNQVSPTDIHHTPVESPEIPDPTPTSYHGSPSPAHRIITDFMGSAGLPPVPVLVENNVNSATIAEHIHGALVGATNAAYLQIGVQLGLGIILDGALRRGGHGGAGEISTIPADWWEGDPPVTELEHQLGSQALLTTASRSWPNQTPPTTTIELIDLAATGHATALSVVTRHATALGRLATAAAAVTDPAVLAIGGGQTHPYLVHLIKNEFSRRNTHTRLTPSTCGPYATVDGATLLARDHALTQLLGNHHTPLLPQPALW